MEAVKQNGNSLKYVVHQTYPICLAAIKEDSEALRFVREKITSIYLWFVKQKIKYIYLVFVKQSIKYLKHLYKHIFK